MTTTTILAAGTSDATSTDVTVAAGATATIAMFMASGTVPNGYAMRVMLDTPGADLHIDTLDANTPAVVISGPGTFRVLRDANAASAGVVSET